MSRYRIEHIKKYPNLPHNSRSCYWLDTDKAVIRFIKDFFNRIKLDDDRYDPKTISLTISKEDGDYFK